MNEQSRLFDFLYYQLDKFPKADLLTTKIDGAWVPLSTQEAVTLINKLSAGLLKLGFGGNDFTVENQDKIALISKNTRYGLSANWGHTLPHLSYNKCK
jgi:long-chain acyl-CoA synthetase